jgi:hypothetical protein
MTVEWAARGAGTVFRLRMEAFGSEVNYRQWSANRSQKVLFEEDELAASPQRLPSSRWKAAKIARDHRHHHATQPDFGCRGGLINRPLMRRLYQQELRNLADYLRGQRSPPVSTDRPYGRAAARCAPTHPRDQSLPTT